MNTTPGAVDFLVAAALVLVTAAATCAALTRDPARQAVVLAVLGVCLSLLFLVLQAPDVALSQLAVGTAVTPLLILLTVRKIRRGPVGRQTPKRPSEGGDER
jgi:energy-converting hydrogenase B subunit D